jgi:hypothetical protein
MMQVLALRTATSSLIAAERRQEIARGVSPLELSRHRSPKPQRGGTPRCRWRGKDSICIMFASNRLAYQSKCYPLAEGSMPSGGAPADRQLRRLFEHASTRCSGCSVRCPRRTDAAKDSRRYIFTKSALATGGALRRRLRRTDSAARSSRSAAGRAASLPEHCHVCRQQHSA